MSKVSEYFESVRKEMSKVSWPTQKELVDNTMVVVIFSIIVSLFIFGIDNVYSSILEIIYR
ncbi:MAG: preprotein translocase subunit SecE [Halomonas sp. BM-2019]|nr:MAG: preprotein translocase subunit SecE [Halomonas sp. BM-2019]